MPNAARMGQAQCTVEEARRTGKPFEKEYFRKDGSLVPILIDAATFEGSEEKGSAFIWKAVFENRTCTSSWIRRRDPLREPFRSPAARIHNGRMMAVPVEVCFTKLTETTQEKYRDMS